MPEFDSIQLIEGLGRGGAERLVVDTANALTRTGGSVAVVHRGGPLEAELSGTSIRVPRGSRFMNWHSSLRRNGVSGLLHVHSVAPLPGVLAYARPRGLPTVMTVHGWSPRKQRAAGAMFRLFSPDLVIAVSPDVQDQLARYGVKSEVLLNGVPDRNVISSPFSAETVRFMTVGRMDRQKRHDVMLQAVAIVVDSGRDVHLDVAGDGELREMLESQVVQLNISTNVTFHGFIDPTPLLATADCYVSSSDYEGLSLAQLEALMSGLPIVTTETSGASLVVERGNGIRVPVGDPNALAKAMIAVVDSRPCSWGVASRQLYLEKYTFSRYLENLAGLYASVA